MGINARLGNSHMADDKTATLYRMVLPDHTCPFGVRAKEMLEDAGYQIDEHILGSREEVDAFEQEQGVTTTPQVFIDGERIGGSDALEQYLASA
jgi:glutaredoxin 3